MEFNQDNKMYHIQLSRSDVGRYVLLTEDPKHTDFIAKHLENATLIAHNREHRTWTGYLNNEKVSVISTGAGCPSTAIALEELIKIGSDTFLYLGIALPICDISSGQKLDGIISTAAVRNEGTTTQYIPIEYPALANRQVTEAIAESASDFGAYYKEGITHSCDSYYGMQESINMPLGHTLNAYTNSLQKGNVMASEQNTSAVFVISSIRNCRAGSICTFGDFSQATNIACGAIKNLIALDKKGGTNL